MNKLLMIACALGSVSAFADQSANWTCTGATVKISAEQPYLGEKSPYAQTLYTLSEKFGSEISTAQYTAFFLTTTATQKGNRSTITGKNGKNGSFTLKIANIRDGGDGTTIKDLGEGTLTYSHGPLSGKNEKVSCVRE